MHKRLLSTFIITTALCGCTLAPNLKLPEISLPSAYKEQSKPEEQTQQANWKPAESLEKSDRGEWWKIFHDESLNALETQAIASNQTLKIAAAHVDEARATARVNKFNYLPDISIGGNAVRAQPAQASLASFGVPATKLSPYTLYDADGVTSYEADLFGAVRENAKAFALDADAQEAVYRSTLLALQADVAQDYFSLRALDAERKLVRETVDVYAESARIEDKKFNVGEAGEPDNTRAQSQLASAKADLIALDRRRAALEHALAVLLGKTPAEFSFAEAPLDDIPPQIPAGLPSSLLERRPDIASAQASMTAANSRIGVARAAFFPRLILTATGGFESTELSDLFKWSSRTWALGQLANDALSMPIFDNGRDSARLSFAEASYDESVANYRQQVLVAFRDVEDNLADQRLLSEQSRQQDVAAQTAARTTELTATRYREGDVDYFQVATEEQNSLAVGRAAIQTRGQRFVTTVTLIRALGGGWDEATLPKAPDAAAASPVPAADEPAPAPIEAPKPLS